jgi:hypothetical protein
MNPKLRKLRLIVASLVMAAATGQSGAADPRHGNTEQLLLASLTRNAASLPPQSTPSRLSAPADLLTLPSDAVAFGDEALDGRLSSRPYSVQLYPSGNGGGIDAAAAPSRIGKDVALSEGPAAAKKAVLPEPGNWATLLAGLLGVGAIARRRMSA